MNAGWGDRSSEMRRSPPAAEQPLVSELVERAIRFAARAHRGQFRKAGDLPYITHPAAVAMILLRAGFSDEAVIAAAWLHDVLEDTPVEMQDLRRLFPERVVAFVAAASERKYDARGRKRPWADRKADHLRDVAAAPWEARAVVLADKLHNLHTMLLDLQGGAELWERFNASPGDVVDYHRRMIAAAAGDDPALDPLAVTARRLLDQLEAHL